MLGVWGGWGGGGGGGGGGAVTKAKVCRAHDWDTLCYQLSAAGEQAEVGGKSRLLELPAWMNKLVLYCIVLLYCTVLVSYYSHL